MSRQQGFWDPAHTYSYHMTVTFSTSTPQAVRGRLLQTSETNIMWHPPLKLAHHIIIFYSNMPLLVKLKAVGWGEEGGRFSPEHLSDYQKTLRLCFSVSFSPVECIHIRVDSSVNIVCSKLLFCAYRAILHFSVVFLRKQRAGSLNTFPHFEQLLSSLVLYAPSLSLYLPLGSLHHSSSSSSTSHLASIAQHSNPPPQELKIKANNGKLCRVGLSSSHLILLLQQ